MPIQQLTTTESSSEKAWHILAHLLSVGRPARPAEIESRCMLFPATPDLIQSLCLIPNSPISLTNNLSVTLSPTVLLNFAEFVANSFGVVYDFRPPIERGSCSEDFLRLTFMSRKRPRFDDLDGCEAPLPKRIQNSATTELHYRITDGISGSINVRESDISVMVNQMMLKPALSLKFSSGRLSCKCGDVVRVEGEVGRKVFSRKMVPKSLLAGKFDSGLALATRLLHHSRHLNSSISIDLTCCLEDMKQSNASLAKTGIVNDACEDSNAGTSECDKIVKDKEKEQCIDLGCTKRIENLLPVLDTALFDMPPENELKNINTLRCDGKQSVDNEHGINVDKGALSPATELAVANRPLRKPSVKAKLFCRDGMDQKVQALSKSCGKNKALNAPKEKKHGKRDQMSVTMAPKAIENQNDIKDLRGYSTSISPKDRSQPKVEPNFDSYIVEEEEGSGGYGTVYRARRKNDGTVVAIKCPHTNANKHHFINELRMLERFGGKNFIIKYQGCFKSGKSDCFVLEHVEHDRPEVLKKEIDISQLQWYGYCMFRALASLHKQGVVHRDVKPGNFLFSRKATKGYLIDFNLALDLHQKYGTTSKLKAGYDISFNHATPPSAKYISLTNSRRDLCAKSLAAVKQEATKGSKSTLEPKNLKRKAVGQTNVYNDLSSRNIINSQGPDGSGITSAKEVTSTRTPSAERLREPLPCQGRKELISLLQDAMRNPNYEALNCPAPMRKRVAAPPGKVGREFIYHTPMPLHSNSVAVTGAGLMNNKGNGKHKKEGPCAGTKGFRAPEVLFRSQHQGPKLDIWSAGVTLLYLITGRAPFFGDPEQNVKDIAKLRGTEDLWEVAKLHNRESSFPQDLYDTRFLAPMNLRDWCKLNTKRPEFFEVIPSSLFDLVDKCLTVNPRLRLSAEDALKHEFFAPCHESLKKQKLLRQELSLDKTTGNPTCKQGVARPVKISQLPA